MKQLKFKRSFILFAVMGMCIAWCATSLSAKSYKNFSILGDSYSTFQDYVEPDTNICWYAPNPKKPTDVTDVKNTWWKKFIEKSGMKLVKNNSFSGSTICNTGYGKADYSDRSFITRMDNLGENPELILVFGATNDLWAKVPRQGKTSDDYYAFTPAMNRLFEGLKTLYPASDVVFMLNDDINGEVRDIVLAKCKEYDVPCLELKDIAKMSSHPSIEGMEAISEQLLEFLNNLPDESSLEGKSIVMLGDSYVRNHRRPYSEAWHSKVADRNKMFYLNYGRNGSSVAFDRTKEGFGPAMTVRCLEMPDNADYVVVIAGHNDADYLARSNGETMPEFRAGLELLLSELQEKYPKAAIGFVTPWGVDRPFFKEVVEEIHLACDRHGIPVLDVSDSAIIDVNNPEFRKEYFQGEKDTAHLNAKGHDLMLQAGESFIHSLKSRK